LKHLAHEVDAKRLSEKRKLNFSSDFGGPLISGLVNLAFPPFQINVCDPPLTSLIFSVSFVSSDNPCPTEPGSSAFFPALAERKRPTPSPLAFSKENQ
jgi:hypothetical protein